MNESVYYLWLLLRLGAGSRTAVRLVRAAGGAKGVWDSLSRELAEAAGVKFSVIAKLQRERDLFDCEDVLGWCADRDIAIITPDNSEYPKSLESTIDYPMVLFCDGRLPDMNEKLCAAVVGTRRMTEYGRNTAYEIGFGLGSGGAVVVSGLALGIDGMAMAGAQSAGAPTVGVLGCGIDVVYPPAHKELFRSTVQCGALITEYPPGTPPAGNHFPMRNRIISGLCQATVVVEADVHSGALITARHAMFQGRQVFAVPGNVDEPSSEGCNQLLNMGASPALCANDVLSKFEFIYPHSVGLVQKSMPAGGLARAAEIVHSAPAGRKKAVYDGKSPGDGRAAGGDGMKKPADGRGVSAHRTAVPKRSEDTKNPRHLDFLGEKERAVYKMMKPNVPMLPDEIAEGIMPVGEVMAALTVLEIAGAVECGAGGYFVRAGNMSDSANGERFPEESILS